MRRILGSFPATWRITYKMVELYKAVRLMGLPHMLKLRRGYKSGFDEMLRGYFSTHAMFALLNVGFIDELLTRDHVSPSEFAQREDLDEETLESTCAAFYELSLFERSNGGYALSAKGRDIVEVLRGWLELTYGYDELFINLEDILRKKKVYGTDFYRRSDFVAKGSGEMEDVLFFPLAIDMIKQGGYKKVLDLGCGDGTFLRKLCTAVPGVTGYGIDLAPAAIEDGKVRAREAGLGDRIHLLAKDISKIQETPEELREIEAATIFFVLHELLYTSEDRVIAFLKDFKRLFPNAPLIAFEAIRPTPEQLRNRPGISVFYYYYHDLSQQKPTSRDKWRELFAKAGYTQVDERFLGFAWTSIFTIR